MSIDTSVFTGKAVMVWLERSVTAAVFMFLQ